MSSKRIPSITEKNIGLSDDQKLTIARRETDILYDIYGANLEQVRGHIPIEVIRLANDRLVWSRDKLKSHVFSNKNQSSLEHIERNLSGIIEANRYFIKEKGLERFKYKSEIDINQDMLKVQGKPFILWHPSSELLKRMFFF